MKRYRRLIFLLVPAFFLIAIPVFAASINFLPKAQKYIDRNCSDRHISNQDSLLCYLFFRTKEQGNELRELESKVASQSARIGILEELSRPVASESAGIRDVWDITFFNGPVAHNAVSSFYIVTGFNNVTFNYHCAVGEAAISIQTSDDSFNWTNQFQAVQAQCVTGGSVPLTVAGRYYRAATSMDNYNPVSITATAHFSK